MLSICVYYRPQHRANVGLLQLYFEGPEMQRWNKPTDRAQRVDEKMCLFVYLSCLLPN